MSIVKRMKKMYEQHFDMIDSDERRLYNSDRSLITQRYRVTGTCQGVGFRYASRQIAVRLRIGGWVQNQKDGSVLLELEGSQIRINEFFRLLAKHYTRLNIRYTVQKISEAKCNNPSPFQIRTTE